MWESRDGKYAAQALVSFCAGAAIFSVDHHLTQRNAELGVTVWYPNKECFQNIYTTAVLYLSCYGNCIHCNHVLQFKLDVISSKCKIISTVCYRIYLELNLILRSIEKQILFNELH